MITEILRPVAYCLIILLTDVIISPWIIINGWSPDFLLIYVLFFATINGKNATLLVGLFAGLIQDITGGVTLGLLALAKSNLGFWFAYWIERKSIVISSWLLSLVVFLSILVQDVWTALFTLQGSEIGLGVHIYGEVIPTAIYTAFISYLFAIFTFSTGKNSKRSSGLR